MPVDHARLEEVFAESLNKVDGAVRAAYLDETCADDPDLRQRVEALLAAHDATGNILRLPEANESTASFVPLSEQPGSKIGRFKLLEQIGEGGFGVVFMAEQEEPVRRMVALKIIKPGMDTGQVIARFEAERQALALMDHANVAKVLDGGVTDTGRPYFVMDLVKGIPITEYCDQQQLSVRRRLELFTQVCRAVQHAHQKGIIHRDLKPSNVLVAEYDGQPVPKIIDFGVAKATGQRLTAETMFTQFGQLIGTFEYMSPEQARFNQLDVDTRSDVYSLGVLLYELLTGSTPFERKRLSKASIDETLRIIREEEPPFASTRLSTSKTLAAIAANRLTEPAKLSREVRGELDWILMKALEKDRNRRYQTANSFASDIEHYLRDEPVQACPPSSAYQLKKYLKRNKVAIAFVGLLAAGVVALSFSNLVIKHERDAKTAALTRATAESVKANEVANYFGQLLGEANPYQANGVDYSVRQLLDDASAGLERRFADQPEIEAEIRATIGEAYRNLDLFQNAEPHLRRVVELRRQTVGSNHVLYADSLVAWAWNLAVQDQSDEANKRVREALSIYRNQSAEPGRRLTALRLLQWIGLSDSKEVVDEATQLAQKLPTGEHPNFASILHVHAEYLADSGEAVAAEKLARRALAMHRRQRPPGHPEIAFAIWTLGVTLENQQKLAEAEDAYREALDLFVEQYGPRSDVRGQQISVAGLVRVLKAQSKDEEAATLLRERAQMSSTTRSFQNVSVENAKGDASKAPVAESSAKQP